MKRPGSGWFLAAAAMLLLAAFFGLALSGYIISAMCLVCAAAVCAFFGLMRLWDTKTAKTLSRAAAACLALLFCLFLAAELPILADSRSDEDTSAEYAIVFGAGVNGTEPSLSLRERLEAAYAWLIGHPEGRAILSGSQGDNERISEARCMFNWLTAAGIAPERLILEEQAGSSYENLRYSLALISETGGDPTGRVALVSSEYHMHRLCRIARELGCQPVRVAARTGHVTLRLNYTVREAFAIWRIWILGPG